MSDPSGGPSFRGPREWDTGNAYQELVEAAGDAIYTFGLDGRFTSMNAAGLRFTGRSRDEIAGMHITEVLAPEFRDAAVERIRARLGPGPPPDRFEAQIQRKDGTTVWLEIGTQVQYRDGRPAGFLGIGRDISDRKRAEERLAAEHAERRRAEDALRESQRRYRHFITQSSDSIWRIAFDPPVPLHLPMPRQMEWALESGRLAECNDVMARVHGYGSAADLVAMPVGKLVQAVPGPDAEELQRFIAAHCGAVETELWMTSRAGRRICVVRRMVGDVHEEQLHGIWGSTRDVTELRTAQEVLRRSEARLRSVIESSPMGMHFYQLEEDGKLVFTGANPAADRILGVPHRDLVGRTIEEAFPALANTEIPGIYRRIALEGAGWQTEQVSYSDGRISGAYEVHAFRSAPGAVAVLFLEVTERRRTLEALARSEAHLMRAQRMASLGSWELDLSSSALLWSDEVYRIFGVPRGEFSPTRDSFYRLVHPEDRDRVQAAVNRALGSGDPYAVEHRVVRPDGVQRHVREGAEAIQNASGAIVGLVGTVQDITDFKRLEEQFLQAQKLESVGRLAGGIAHDFNNLLTVINGHCNVALAGMQPGEPHYDRFRCVLQAGERAADLTQRLLAFSRKQVLQPRVFSVNQAILGLVSMLQRMVGEQVELVTDLGGEPVRVRADQGQLEQAVMNLAVNARDAMPGGGTLRLSTELRTLTGSEVSRVEGWQPGRYVLIAVSDTGTGMDEQTRQHIFEPFFTTKEVGKGTGLGLSTVYGIVKQSGGHIEVDSRPGEGSVFRIYLPEAPEEAAAFRPEPARPRVAAQGTVLLVEDQEQVRCLMAETLESCGYQVHQARLAEEALEIARELGSGLSLLISDVVLPRMSGPELAMKLAATLPGVAILLVSGYLDPVKGLPPSAVFLQKPFSPGALLERVREALQRKPRA